MIGKLPYRIVGMAAVLAAPALCLAQSGSESPSVDQIVQLRCAPCHRAAGPAPFVLAGAEDLRPRAGFIRQVVASGYMPPWPEASPHGTFQNDKRLPPAEKQALLDWIDAGMPNITGSKPQTPVKSKAGSPSPAYSLSFHKKVRIPGNNEDHFVYYLHPEPLPQDLHVSHFRFEPGNLQVVHHTELLVAPPGTALPSRPARLMDEAYFSERYDSLFGRHFQYVTGWLPGNQGDVYPEGMGLTLPKGARLILMVHYAPSPVRETDRTSLKIYTTPEPPRREMQSIDLHTGDHLENGPFFLPAGAVRTFHSSRTIDADFSVVSIFPHAHHLCTEMQAFAVTPSRDTISLLQIPRWDFDWQYTYTLPRPIVLKQGTVVHFLASYDNTAANPENPSSPPADVIGSFESVNEMMELFLWGLPYESGDESLELVLPDP